MCYFHFLFALLLTVFILVFSLAFGVWLFSYLKSEYPSGFSIICCSSFRLQVQHRGRFKGQIYCVDWLFFPRSCCAIRGLRTKRHGGAGCNPGRPAVRLPGYNGLPHHPYSKGQGGLEEALWNQPVQKHCKFKNWKVEMPKITGTLWDEFGRLCPVLDVLDHQMKLSNSI